MVRKRWVVSRLGGVSSASGRGWYGML